MDGTAPLLDKVGQDLGVVFLYLLRKGIARGRVVRLETRSQSGDGLTPNRGPPAITLEYMEHIKT
jgi:hypothetical protein